MSSYFSGQSFSHYPRNIVAPLILVHRPIVPSGINSDRRNSFFSLFTALFLFRVLSLLSFWLASLSWLLVVVISSTWLAFGKPLCGPWTDVPAMSRASLDLRPISRTGFSLHDNFPGQFFRHQPDQRKKKNRTEPELGLSPPPESASRGNL